MCDSDIAAVNSGKKGSVNGNKSIFTQRYSISEENDRERERGTIFSSLYASLVDVINLSHNNHKESLLGARLK